MTGPVKPLAMRGDELNGGRQDKIISPDGLTNNGGADNAQVLVLDKG